MYLRGGGKRIRLEGGAGGRGGGRKIQVKRIVRYEGGQREEQVDSCGRWRYTKLFKQVAVEECDWRRCGVWDVT